MPAITKSLRFLWFFNAKNATFCGFQKRLDTPIMDEFQGLREKLVALKEQHRDLDDVLTRLGESYPRDELQLRRLKKRKLQLKDEIMNLESMLIPDIIA